MPPILLGSITIDGVDIKKISQDSLRSQIGVVLQETFLFSGTIYQTIAYAKEGATRDEVLKVSKLAGCHSFIMRMPDGYNTMLTGNGSNLSQGQRQLLSFARTIVHKPSVMILDEATANIDTETEILIQDSLEKMMNIGTMLIVAHRLSTIKDADRILVMKDGNVIEIGSHNDLISKKGFYYNLYKSQFEV